MHTRTRTSCELETVCPTARHDRATRSRTEILQAIRLSYLSRAKPVTSVSRVRFFFPLSHFPATHPFFSSPIAVSVFPFFFSFFFLAPPFAKRPRNGFNNLSRAVNREIDRRSSRKLLLRRIRLKVLFIRVSRNLFVRETCFAAQCRPFDTRGNSSPRKLNKSRRCARVGMEMEKEKKKGKKRIEIYGPTTADLGVFGVHVSSFFFKLYFHLYARIFFLFRKNIRIY